jgi:integrase
MVEAIAGCMALAFGGQAPPGLRRTCARLCHDCSGELEQIRFLLGHASIQTTERYIGSTQKLQDAVNDRFEISVASDTA